MKCPRCQHENEAGAKFCEECAGPLARTCGNCGRHLSPTAKFCPECASPTGLPAEGFTAARFTSPASYTPKHLADRILDSKATLEGERKQITVLFADLKGSMELLADRDPEEARKILDPVLERMMQAVHRYEGTVNQVMGDGIMALFGAPLAHEDHAVRACYAALHMQERMKQYAGEIRRTTGAPVQIRIGVNSGEVVVRSIGGDLRMDYTAVGQTTHLAARMEQMATPGSILITPSTASLAEGYVQVKPLGALPVKGMAAPLEVYEVTRAGPVRSRFQVAVERGLTKFVGRSDDLSQLEKALALAAAGHGQMVAVVGEPGVGKSRLCHEFMHSDRTEGWLILESQSVSYGQATPYLPLIDLLKAYFRIEPGDDTRSTCEQVAARVLTLDRALEPTLPALLALLDLPVEEPEWPHLDPSQRRERTFDAIKRLLLRESQVQPLCLMFEDLHWIDDESQVFLDRLIESLPTARILLLVNYRPEYEHRWAGKTYYTQVRIDPLAPASADEFLQALLGTDADLTALKALLIQRTDGNPFFLEESVRTLAETHALTGERGAYRLGAPLSSLQIPSTVHAVLAARIDRLPAEDKSLLQIAAVIGKDVQFQLLHAVAARPEARIRGSVSDLQAAEFLYESRLFPDLEYTFKHALTHEVAYGTLLQDRRRDLHAKVAETIERIHGDRLAEHVERLAHHTFRGETWEKAVAYAHQAGRKALDRSAGGQAGAYLDQALKALARLHVSPAMMGLAFDLRVERLAAHSGLGELDRQLQCAEETLALAEKLEDQRRIGQATSAMGNALWQLGANVRARALLDRAFAIAEKAGDVTFLALAGLNVGMICRSLGDHRRVVAVLGQTVNVLTGERASQRFGYYLYPAVVSRNVLAVSLAELGEFRQATMVAEESIRIAEALQQPASLIQAHAIACSLLLLSGEFEPAITRLERTLSLHSTPETDLQYSLVANWLGYAYTMTGRLADALALLGAAVERARRVTRREEAFVTIRLGQAYLAAGRTADALATAERALALSRERSERGNEAKALHLLGEIASRRDPADADEAEARYREAAALSDELAMRPLLAHCHFALGTLHRRNRWGEQARKHLAIAAIMYREMEMRFWLEHAEAETRGLA